jgi:uncharacterized protein YecT (DUF1311 family)
MPIVCRVIVPVCEEKAIRMLNIKLIIMITKMKFYKNEVAGLLTMIILAFASYTTSAQSQTAMKVKAGSGFQKADQELNKVYQKIIKEYAAQPQFIKKLKVAQRLWVQLRDAELAAKYPETGTYGSVAPMCESVYLESLTRERIKFLQVWLNGIPEGDVCSGSVKNR